MATLSFFTVSESLIFQTNILPRRDLYCVFFSGVLSIIVLKYDLFFIAYFKMIWTPNWMIAVVNNFYTEIFCSFVVCFMLVFLVVYYSFTLYCLSCSGSFTGGWSLSQNLWAEAGSPWPSHQFIAGLTYTDEQSSTFTSTGHL